MFHVRRTNKLPYIKNTLSIKFEANFDEINMYIRFHNSCDTDLGRSIAVVIDNIHAIDVVKPVHGYQTFLLTATVV